MKGKKRFLKKAFAGVMAIALTVTGIQLPEFAAKSVKAADDEIVLPITLRDFDADNLLFEYCLEKDSIRDWSGSEVPYLAFTDKAFANRIPGTNFVPGTSEQDGETFDASYVEKLVQDTLVDGHPQYRQEAVEEIAKVVKGALEVPVTNVHKNYYAKDRQITYQDKQYRKLREKLGTPVGDGKQKITNPYTNEPVPTLGYDNPELFAVTVELGNYAETKAKADSGQLNFDNLETAMDYTYYMLNNFFVSKNDINTTYNNNFQNITLKGDGQGNYTFDARKGKNVGYYADTNNISNDTAGATYTTNTGLFPLDNVATDEHKYLDNFSQASIDFDPAIKDKTPGQEHNFHYSLAGHSRFYYYDTSDLYFHFQGDDDVYLFINGKLALDIGGAHSLADKTITLDRDMAKELGLENGKVYDFDFFYMDRHTTNANLFIETNIKLLAKGETTVKLSTTEGPKEDGSSVQENKEKIFVEYDFKANTDGVQEIVFTDEKTGITISKEGIQKDDDIKLVDPSTHEETGKITVEITKDSKTEISKTEIYECDSEGIKELFNNITLNTDDTIKITGIETVSKDNDGKDDDHKYQAELVVQFIAPKYTGVNGYPETIELEAQQELVLLTEYTVRYVEKGTDNPVADAKPVNGKHYGEQVEETAKDVVGWKLSGASTQTVTIDAADKVITFEYIQLLNVTFNTDGNGTVDGKDEVVKENVEKGTTVEKAEEKANEGYAFAGWTVDVAGGEKTETPDKNFNPATYPIIADTTFTAHFEKSEYTYSVKYLDRETEEEVASSDNGLGAKYNDEVTITAKDVKGYKPEFESKQVTVDENNKVFVIYYDKQQYPYTVKYVDKDGNDLLPSKDGGNKAFGEDVTEKAEKIDGYTADKETKSITIEDGTNEIVFVYTKKNYTVIFEADENGKLEEDATTEFKVNYKEKVEDVPGTVPDEDYEFLKWRMTVNGETTDVADPAQVEIVADTVFTAYFTNLPSYKYTVKYVDKNGKDLIDPESGSDVIDHTVTVKYKPIDGYKVDKEEDSVKITEDEDSNLIIFVYTKQHKVTFRTDGNGTLDGETNYTVDDGEKVGEKPKTNPNANYEFVKWTMTVGEKTTDVEDPANVEITDDTVFTAVFKEIPTTETPTTTEVPTTTEAPTTTVTPTTQAPIIQEPTTEEPVIVEKKTTKEKVVPQPTTTQYVAPVAPQTGYNKLGLFMAIFAGLAAAIGGLVLSITGRKKED